MPLRAHDQRPVLVCRVGLANTLERMNGIAVRTFYAVIVGGAVGSAPRSSCARADLRVAVLSRIVPDAVAHLAAQGVWVPARNIDDDNWHWHIRHRQGRLPR